MNFLQIIIPNLTKNLYKIGQSPLRYYCIYFTNNFKKKKLSISKVSGKINKICGKAAKFCRTGAPLWILFPTLTAVFIKLGTKLWRHIKQNIIIIFLLSWAYLMIIEEEQRLITARVTRNPALAMAHGSLESHTLKGGNISRL